MGDVPMKRVALNPCRKCGYDRMRKSDRVDLGDYGCLIKCPRCRARASIGEFVADAVEAWNRENPIAEESS